MGYKFDMNKRIQQAQIEKRNRIIMRNHLVQGLRVLRTQKWLLVFPLLLVMSTAFIFCNLNNVPLPVDRDIPELAGVWELAIVSLAVTFDILLMWGLLYLLGTPRKEKSINRGLQHIGLLDRYGIAPALLLNRAVDESGARKLFFFSEGISADQWIEHKSAIESRLNCRLIELIDPIETTGDSNYIVLVVIFNTKGQRNDVLYDDEL